jgi:hypothetical protein
VAVIAIWLITNHSEVLESFVVLEASVSTMGQHYIRLRLDKMSQITYVSINISPSCFR